MSHLHLSNAVYNNYVDFVEYTMNTFPDAEVCMQFAFRIGAMLFFRAFVIPGHNRGWKSARSLYSLEDIHTLIVSDTFLCTKRRDLSTI